MASRRQPKQKKHVDKHASELPNAPGPRQYNSLQKLTMLKPRPGQEFGVVAYVLNRDMIRPDGTLDDLHGMVFHLGSFHTLEAAEEHAKKIIAETKHPAILPVRYSYPLRLVTKFEPEAVTEVALNAKGELMKLESSRFKREQKEYERQVEIEKEVLKEAEEETDPEHIEHFKRQAYLAIKNQSKFRMLMKEAEKALADYKKREAMVRDHFQRHPEHEAEWLPYLKAKLVERGEGELYGAIEKGYQEIREELLGLVPSDDSSSSSYAGASSSDEAICSGGICMASSEIMDSDEDTEEVEESNEVAEESSSIETQEGANEMKCEGNICTPDVSSDEE